MSVCWLVTMIPPITTVAPSSTVTLVSADCVSIAGMPCTRGCWSIWSFFDGHVHVDRSVRGDLRGHVQFEHRVHELHGNGVVDDRLHRNLGSLLDGGLLVVLRDDFRLREQLADAAVLRGVMIMSSAKFAAEKEY